MTRWLALVALSGCVIGEIHVGNGTTGTEVRDVGEFSGVSATMSIPVDVAAGPERTVTVTCDENLLADIETVVEGADLVVRAVHSGARFVVIDPTVDCRVAITTPAADQVTKLRLGAVDGDRR